MLDLEIKEQLKNYLGLLENEITIKLGLGNDQSSKEMEEFINEITSLTNKISVEKGNFQRIPSFSINRKNEDTGVIFSGIPLGHEFTSLVLAILQVGGRALKLDQSTIDAVKNLKGKHEFVTYVSLTCHNCPDVVQALNMMSVINPNITHTMVDGAMFKDEVESKEIMSVPSVYLNNEFFESGRMEVTDILKKLGSTSSTTITNRPVFDVLVIGGGPAGASAAIYAARKGIKTGLVAEKMGGQVLDTLSIENLISVTHTEGPKLGKDLENHVREYNVDIMKSQLVSKVEKNELFEVYLDNGTILKSKTVIVASGARWRNVNVPGEAEFKNKGVAYCPHCDGPLFKGKDVSVIGGGNSGIEAAIDLAGICNHVTVLEFLPELKADKVLQDKLYSLPNVTVVKNAQTKEITGTDKVNGITYIDRSTGAEHHVELQGVFVQIGLVPNTTWLDLPEKNRMGEIIVDVKGNTNIPGLFAAGDCTNSPYKQIIISMGSGAVAALTAFDYIIRN